MRKEKEMMSLNRRRLVRIAAALTVTAALLAPALYGASPALSRTVSSAVIRTATFSSPALCADAGEVVDLASCEVQFAAGDDPVPGKDITWTKDGAVVTSVSAGAPGVTALTASSGSLKRTVYLVAKAAGDKEYTLWETDFSEKCDLRTVQSTAGTQTVIDTAAGVLLLNASNSGDGYIRVLFPEWLDVFGDAIVEADLLLDSPNGATSRWGSVMYRVQNSNYPYMHAALRYDSSASNGSEIAQRNESNAWNVIVKGACSSSNETFNAVRVEFAGKHTSYMINGKEILKLDNTYYDSGAMGLQVRGVTMKVDGIRVKVNPDSKAEAPSMPGNYAGVLLPASHIALTPVRVTEAAGSDIGAALAALADGTPEVAVFGWKSGRVTLGSDSVGLAGFMKKTKGMFIPAFRTDAADAASLAAALKEGDFRDAYILSGDAEAIKTARSVWRYLNAVYDCPDGRYASAEEIRRAAVSCEARAVIMPEGFRSAEAVAHLQDRYLVCWAETDGSDASVVAAVNSGFSGIVTPSPSAASEIFDKYYPANTLTRYPNVIGHRGIPSQAQENSLAGCVKAFEYGANMVENDIYLVKGGSLMVMHDSTIDRTTDGSGAIAAMTAEQLSRYMIDSYAGASPEPIPSLSDYFDEFGGKKGRNIVIEIKPSSTSIAKPLADMINEYGILGQVVVISFHTEPLVALRRLMPDISVAWLNSSVSPNENDPVFTMSTLLDTLQPTASVYSPSYASGSLGPKLTGALFCRGITTWIWTVNKRADFDRYFVAGTRGITTNYSDWVSSYIKELYVRAGDDGRYGVYALTYKGNELDVTKKAVMTVVDDGGTGVSFDAGSGTFSGSTGTAKVFFTYTSQTSSGDRYSKVTELLSVETGHTVTTAEVTAAEITPAGVTSAEAGTPGTGEGGDGITGGCSSAAHIAGIAASLALAAPCIARSRGKKRR